jgi:UDP-2-acetamido-3-amino-2,3-dideoxy-glucuronate N-acetyltransferase
MPIDLDANLASDAKVFYPDLVNLYGCSIGSGTTIGPFVEIQKHVTVGARCKISSHTFICEGVTIEDEVFVGHGVMFINDLYPRATGPDGQLQSAAEWELVHTRICRGASIGSGATILGGIVVGDCALIGAGAVVTRDVPAFAIVVGNPARVVGDTRDRDVSKLSCS